MTRKIYNEIVIDMNPESSTFEDIIHEDSFMDDGEIVLLKEGAHSYSRYDSTGKKYEVRYNMNNLTSEASHYWYYLDGKEITDSGDNEPTSTLKGWVDDWTVGDRTVGGTTGTPGDIYDTLDDYNVAQGELDTSAFGGEDGFGQEGLEYADLVGKNPLDIFNILQERGAIPEGDTFTDWEEEIRKNMPKQGGVSEEDMAAYEAGVAEDVYGFETDIARAEEDIGVAGEGARSDIYGLQGAGAQQKRKGMFGKGLGGGMSQLAQQDASVSMRSSGQGIMAGLASTVRGERRGIEDATTGLYGVGGTGVNDVGVGGIYGAGGSKDTDLYNITQEADDKWEGDMEGWIASNLAD